MIAKKIQQKAYEIGIHKCGIINPESMMDYKDRLLERMSKIPNGEKLYDKFLKFADIKKSIPWAKSIIVLVFHYGHYILPKESIVKSYGKSYLVDSRFNTDAEEYVKAQDMEGVNALSGATISYNQFNEAVENVLNGELK
jgi:epoxyqueuosine reductase QueG